MNRWQQLIRSALQKMLRQPTVLSKKEKIAADRERVKKLIEAYPGDAKRQWQESGMGKSTFYARRSEVMNGLAT
jgi:hypothetical protein